MRKDEKQETAMSQSVVKPYEELRLSDDFMFWKVMLDRDYADLILLENAAFSNKITNLNLQDIHLKGRIY